MAGQNVKQVLKRRGKLALKLLRKSVLNHLALGIKSNPTRRRKIIQRQIVDLFTTNFKKVEKKTSVNNAMGRKYSK